MRMFNTDYLQLIPLLSLTAYFFYLAYYYAAPMFCLKVLLFYAHIKYRGVDIRFVGERITMKYENSEEERLIERTLATDPTSRFFAMTVCSEFRGMLREMKNGVIVTEEGDDGLSTGKRACRAGRQGTEEDCD